MNEQRKSTIKFISATIVILFLLYLASLFFDLIIMLSISILLAMIFDPLVDLVEGKGLSRSMATLIVFLVVGFFLIWGISYFVPVIIQQMNAIAQSINQQKLNILLKEIQKSVTGYVPFLDTSDFAAKLSEFLSTLFFSSISDLSHVISSIVSVVATLIIIPFMTYFLLKDNKKIIKGIINIMPNRYFEMSYSVLHEINIQLSRFVRGWIFDAFMVGFLSAIGLTILGIKNAITIGVVAGLGHLIPYFGPIVGGLPALLFSIVQFGDLSKLPAIIIMFAIIYAIDNGFIQPNVFSKSTDFHPLAIIILILLGEQLLGVLGMLLAVPVATVLKTAAKEIYLGYKNYKVIKLH